MAQSELPQSWPLPADDAPSLGGGRFRLAAQLGEGGMARVYRAWDLQEEQWVAIKVLLPEYARKRKLRKRFMNEAQTLLGLDHRHVVKVLAVGDETEVHPFIAMELADGGCVIDWVERYGPMPPRMAIDVVMQACKGLKASHEQNIVHRDVKPHNILLTRRGVCRLTDFGIARIDESDGGGMTRTGSVMGTMGYMAPEQRTDSKAVDARADIYGLAATLYKLLTAQSPSDLFLAEHDANVLEGVPDALVPALVKATSYNRDQRHGTVTEFAKDLHTAKQTLPPDPEDTPDLAMEIDTSIDTTLGSRPELSEPTLPNLPEVAGLNGSHEVDDRSTVDPLEPRQNIPYSMPTQDARRSDADYVPDYIDSASVTPAPARREESIELDETSRKRAEAAFQRAVAAGKINPDGTPVDDPDKKDPRQQRQSNFFEDAIGLAFAFLGELLSVLWRPIQVFAAVGGTIALLTTVLVVTSASVVNTAMIQALSARSVMFTALDDNKVVMGDLKSMGADEGMVTSYWYDYDKAPTALEKVDHAYKLIDRIHSTFEYQKRHGNAHGPSVRLARERINKIDLAVKDYEDKMVQWEREATSTRGKLAVSFGAAYRPGDPEAESSAP